MVLMLESRNKDGSAPSFKTPVVYEEVMIVPVWGSVVFFVFFSALALVVGRQVGHLVRKTLLYHSSPEVLSRNREIRPRGNGLTQINLKTEIKSGGECGSGGWWW